MKKCDYCESECDHEYQMYGVNRNFCEEHWNTPMSELGLNILDGNPVDN